MGPIVECLSRIFFGLVAFNVFVEEIDRELVAYAVYSLQEVKVVLSWIRLVRRSNCHKPSVSVDG